MVRMLKWKQTCTGEAEGMEGVDVTAAIDEDTAGVPMREVFGTTNATFPSPTPELSPTSRMVNSVEPM